MYVLKYKIGDEVVYRLSESSTPSNIQLRKDGLVGPAKKASESVMTHFGMVDKVLREKVEPEPVAEEPKTASIASVIRQYAVALKEN
jgi:hypothetical protein